jgi:hypothetical protein
MRVRHVLDFEWAVVESWPEGETSPASGYPFRRWRHSRR